MPSRRAVIDIGTNSVKLLVADCGPGPAVPVLETSRQTRLGAGMYESGRLQPDAIARTAAAVAELRAAAAGLGAGRCAVIATSAAREAANADDLTGAVRKTSGLEMEILTGDLEAEGVFKGVAGGPGVPQGAVLILDVGGGSTEFIVGRGGAIQFQRSYPLGTVRLLEKLRPGDPPGNQAFEYCRQTLRKFLDAETGPDLEAALLACGGGAALIGTGGSATLLARLELGLTEFDRARIETAAIPLAGIQTHLREHWNMPLAQRRLIPGLPPDRADVILTGAAIYEAIMLRFGFATLGVSTRGLRFWALTR